MIKKVIAGIFLTITFTLLYMRSGRVPDFYLYSLTAFILVFTFPAVLMPARKTRTTCTPDSAASSCRREFSLVLFAILFAAVLLPYLTVLETNGFIGDEWGHVTFGELHAHDFSLMKMIPEGNIRPIPRAFYVLEFILFGFNPRGYQIMAFLLHFLNALLLFYLVTKLSGSWRTGFISALFFGVFPINPESVSFIAQSFELFVLLFFILSFIFYIKHLEAPKRKNNYYLFLSLLFFTLSIFSKETGLALPVIIICYELLLKRKKPDWKYVLQKTRLLLPFFMIIAAYFVFRFSIFGGIGGYTINGSSVHLRFPGFESLLTRFLSVFKMMLVPLNMEVFKHYLQAEFLAAGIMTILFFVFIMIGANGLELLGFSIFWIIITMLPVINITSFGRALENTRFFYLPSAGFTIFTGCLVAGVSWRKPGKIKIFQWLLPGLITLLYAFALYQNNQPWKKEKDLSAQFQKEVKELFPGFFPQKGRVFCLSYPGSGKLSIPGSGDNQNSLPLVMNLLRKDVKAFILRENKIITNEPLSEMLGKEIDPGALKLGSKDFFIAWNGCTGHVDDLTQMIKNSVDARNHSVADSVVVWDMSEPGTHEKWKPDSPREASGRTEDNVPVYEASGILNYKSPEVLLKPWKIRGFEVSFRFWQTQGTLPARIKLCTYPPRSCYVENIREINYNEQVDINGALNKILLVTGDSIDWMVDDELQNIGLLVCGDKYQCALQQVKMILYK